MENTPTRDNLTEMIAVQTRRNLPARSIGRNYDLTDEVEAFLFSKWLLDTVDALGYELVEA